MLNRSYSDHNWPGLSLSILFLLSVLFSIPVFLSVFMRTVEINDYSGFAMVVVAVGLTIFYRSHNEKVEILSIKENRFLLFGFFLFSLVWSVSGIPVFFIDRYIFLLCVALFFLVLSDVFTKDFKAFLTVLGAKALVVMAIVLFFWIFIYFFQDPDLVANVKSHPPVYRHLRHLNYDLFFTLPILVYLLRRNSSHFLLILALFSALVISIWTAGRGMFLGLSVCFLLVRLRYWKSLPNTLELICLVLVLLALAFVIFTDQTLFLYRTFLRTVADSSINDVSSNRIKIWAASLDFLVHRSFVEQLFGLGPDGFLRYGVWGGNITHPHNSLVQILLEFGFSGLLAFVFLLFNLVRKSLDLVLKSVSELDVLAASLLIGGICFSLVDGIFYHAAPLTMMLILICFVLVRHRDLVDKGFPVPLISESDPLIVG